MNLAQRQLCALDAASATRQDLYVVMNHTACLPQKTGGGTMELEVQTLRQNIYEKFCSIDEDYLLSMFEGNSTGDALFVLRELIQLRRSIATTNPNKATYPYISSLINILCDLKEELNTSNRTTQKSLYDGFSNIIKQHITNFSNYVTDNKEDISYEISKAYYIYCSNKIIRVDQVEENVINTKNEIANLYNEIKEIYANTGVHLFATEFSDIAKKERIAKFIWLSISIFTIIVILLYLYYFNKLIISDDGKILLNSFNEVLYSLIIKIPTVLILLLSFSWASKRYASARDKEMIYRHIASTLHTFKSFYNSVDENHKSLVLMEAAKIIFPAPSEKSSDTTIDAAKMLDIVKLLSQTATKKGEP